MLQLMQLEIDKAETHDYPISCMLLGLDEVQGPHGEQAHMAVMPGAFQLLKRVTFEGEVQGLGFWSDRAILAVFPHVSPDRLGAVGEDLLKLIRQETWPSLDSEVAPSMSAGISHNQHSGATSFENLIREADTGCSMARQAGGDRVVQWVEVETELDRLHEELAEQMREVERRGELFAREQDTLAESRSKEFVKLIETLFSREKPSEVVVRLEKEMIALALDQVENWRDSSLARELTESKRQVDNLERRVRKLTDLLDVTETELQRVASMKSVDTGIASIYRTVQGIATD
jgi:GGDEF domain-containing protein